MRIMENGEGVRVKIMIRRIRMIGGEGDGKGV
jgi:hypothetical protein